MQAEPSANHMSSTTLNSISADDAKGIELNGTFELGVGVKFNADNTEIKPIYSETTLNYDTSSVLRSSVPGTDYTYIQPNENQVAFTALSDGNFKIKIS